MSSLYLDRIHHVIVMGLMGLAFVLIALAAAKTGKEKLPQLPPITRAEVMRIIREVAAKGHREKKGGTS